MWLATTSLTRFFFGDKALRKTYAKFASNCEDVNSRVEPLLKEVDRLVKIVRGQHAAIAASDL